VCFHIPPGHPSDPFHKSIVHRRVFSAVQYHSGKRGAPLRPFQQEDYVAPVAQVRKRRQTTRLQPLPQLGWILETKRDGSLASRKAQATIMKQTPEWSTPSCQRLPGKQKLVPMHRETSRIPPRYDGVSIKPQITSEWMDPAKLLRIGSRLVQRRKCLAGASALVSRTAAKAIHAPQPPPFRLCGMLRRIQPRSVPGIGRKPQRHRPAMPHQKPVEHRLPSPCVCQEAVVTVALFDILFEQERRAYGGDRGQPGTRRSAKWLLVTLGRVQPDEANVAKASAFDGIAVDDADELAGRTGAVRLAGRAIRQESSATCNEWPRNRR
jgi:hypothetical protein